jgi:hypothetical protein
MKQTTASLLILVLLVYLAGCADDHPTRPAHEEGGQEVKVLDSGEFGRDGHRFQWVSRDTCFRELSPEEVIVLEEEALQNDDVQEAIALLTSDGFTIEIGSGFGWKAITDELVGESSCGEILEVTHVVMTQFFLSLWHSDPTIREAEIVYCKGRQDEYLGVSAAIFSYTENPGDPIRVDEVYSSGSNRAFSFWDCWFGPTLEVCAGAVIGCAVSGPAYAKCVVAICGGHAVGRAVRCGFKKWGWSD